MPARDRDKTTREDAGGWKTRGVREYYAKYNVHLWVARRIVRGTWGAGVVENNECIGGWGDCKGVGAAQLWRAVRGKNTDGNREPSICGVGEGAD